MAAMTPLAGGRPSSGFALTAAAVARPGSRAAPEQATALQRLSARQLASPPFTMPAKSFVVCTLSVFQSSEGSCSARTMASILNAAGLVPCQWGCFSVARMYSKACMS